MNLSDVTIDDRQVALHKTTESLALLVVAPFLVYVASRKALPGWARVTAGVLAAGSLVVDGGLLAKWKRLGA